MKPLHENKEYIKNLFYEQIKALSLKSSESFDYQFSDRWL
jgi:hypothetical protein